LPFLVFGSLFELLGAAERTGGDGDLDLRLGVTCLGAGAAAVAFLGELGKRLAAAAATFGGLDLRRVPVPFPFRFDET